MLLSILNISFSTFTKSMPFTSLNLSNAFVCAEAMNGIAANTAVIKNFFILLLFKDFFFLVFVLVYVTHSGYAHIYIFRKHVKRFLRFLKRYLRVVISAQLFLRRLVAV